MDTPSSITVSLPDGTQRTYPWGSTARDVAVSLGKRLGRDAVGAWVDEKQLVDVHTPLEADCRMRIVPVGSPEAWGILRHSAAHIMASAVQALFPETQVALGPAVEDGFYYDFYRKDGFKNEDLALIEARMAQMVASDMPFVRQEVDRQTADKLFRDKGEIFKCEVIASIPPQERLTLYQHGTWVDVCRGPHLPSTGYLKAFKLTHTAGAYWRGDAQQPMLTRIYGTAFGSQAELEAHLEALQEAKKRDHRRLGKDLDLFSFHPWAPAMPFFHPHGALIYNTLVDWIRGYYRVLGFQEVITPQLVDIDLYKKSGHYDHYVGSMFFCDMEGRTLSVKPMNCPGHTLLYSAQKRSYRDLPLRYADFGRLHRYEASGVTAGLTRVRSFSQDDAHIFCREDQVCNEIKQQILMIQEIYQHFGFAIHAGFASRPASSLGREPGLDAQERSSWDHLWQHAEDTLSEALHAVGLPFELKAGDGAFYGPKIDFQVRDALGRWHQLGTLQLDFAMPKRFNLRFVDASGQTRRPVMIHRAVLGSLERFIAILLEHCAGDVPVWLAPTQVRVVTVNDALLAYAQKVAKAFAHPGLRVQLDERSEKLGFKIRDAEMHKIPVVAVLGLQEQHTGSVTLRWRKKEQQGPQPLDHAVKTVLEAAAPPSVGDALLEGVDPVTRLNGMGYVSNVP